jgi:hypothetical protein
MVMNKQSEVFARVYIYIYMLRNICDKTNYAQTVMVMNKQPEVFCIYIYIYMLRNYGKKILCVYHTKLGERVSFFILHYYLLKKAYMDW